MQKKLGQSVQAVILDDGVVQMDCHCHKIVRLISEGGKSVVERNYERGFVDLER